MLRVITQSEGERFRLVLHGALAGEWVVLLEKHWRGIVAEAPTASVVLVLSEVDYVDFEGEQLLHRMAKRGVEFVASGCMNRHLVESLKKRHARKSAT